MSNTRKWTAELSVGGQEFPCPTSARDTLADQIAAAVAEARELICEYEIGSDASVTLYKRTQRDGLKYDRSVYVYRDYETREIRVQR
jgi:hypothetical protein